MMLLKLFRMEKLHVAELAAERNQKTEALVHIIVGSRNRQPVTITQPLTRGLIKNSCSPIMPSAQEQGAKRLSP